jgi:hypothetical protein
MQDNAFVTTLWLSVAMFPAKNIVWPLIGCFGCFRSQTNFRCFSGIVEGLGGGVVKCFCGYCSWDGTCNNAFLLAPFV